MNFFRTQDNFIQITKGAVSKRDCDALIKIFENSNNDYVEEREYSACSMNILSQECISFRNALITSLEKYGKKYLFLKSTPAGQMYKSPAFGFDLKLKCGHSVPPFFFTVLR